MVTVTLNQEEVQRYSRQLMISEIGLAGQERLLKARVLVVGAGGLGCPSLLYLVAAGVGNVAIVDFDKVHLSNLQRQVLYSENDVGKSKVVQAKKRLVTLSSRLKIKELDTAITTDNVIDIISNYDLVLDASDNFKTRYLLNDACYIRSIPLISGSIFQLEGQVTSFHITKEAPCYRCLYPSPPPKAMIPNCSEGGALGSVAGVIGSIQATECIKTIVGIGESLSGKILNINMVDLDFSILKYNKSSNCKLCSANSSIHAIDPSSYEFGDQCELSLNVKKITGIQLQNIIKTGDQFLLINVKEGWERNKTSLIRNEISIPLSVIEKGSEEIIGKLLQHGKNVFYCEDGSRSELAVSLVQKEIGYANLYSFEGDPGRFF